MIPEGRAVKSEAEIAAEQGMALTTWRRNEAPAFRRALKPVNGSERLKLYDVAQVAAYYTGQPIPPAPTEETATPHPDDQLTDREAAALLGIDASTVRGYAAEGYLPPGPRWSRRDIETRKTAGDQRGADRRSTAHQRAAEVRQWLDAAERGERTKVTINDVRQRFGISERTALRTLAQAREPAGPDTGATA
ncbi:helix-turn-helix domain-containing protein [Streptomyces chrestomyceticus]|uniref:helix-turn-helix domain-containing protein n=1 Tax=Streptomyces chrestomyceticus TaxID=68185 RepID=UPI00340882FA